MRALVGDDSGIAARMLGNVLTQLGHEVVGHGKNGAEVVKLFDRLKPEVVFLDIVMPEMDGLAALRAIKAIDRNMNVIMVSSVAGVGSNIDEAHKLGALAIISKPFSSEDISTALAKCF